MTTSSLADSYRATREELRRVATHILARAQHAATGRIGLRVAPGGFSTVQLGAEGERLRVSDGLLVRESGGAPSSTRTLPLHGSTLAHLAAFADVDLASEVSVGHDTPAIGDVHAPLALTGHAVEVLGAWYGLSARALDQVVSTSTTPGAAPTVAQLWPEHFDLALDLAFDGSAPAERRVNLGGSPGDAFHSAPYLYVGPWTSDRPGDPAWWNAPFGAVLGYDDVMSAPDPRGTAVRFFRDGIEKLSA